MKLTSTNIGSLLKSSIAVVERDEPNFTSGFHAHPELELVYIKEGFGKRIIGNKIADFKKDELVLIGSNVPHIWISDESIKDDDLKKSKSIVVYFDLKIFSDIFYEMEETRQLKALFAAAEQGVEITGTAKKQTIATLKKMTSAKGIDKIVCLLEMLDNIALSTETNCINNRLTAKQPQASDRLTHVFDHINLNFKKNIALKDVAKIINLTPGSFCRFFKQKTGKKFVDYLHETRIFYASQSLLNTDLTIAEIAYKTGFKTASNFNKLFKKSTGCCPTEYRRAAACNVT